MSCAAAPQELGVFSIRISFLFFFSSYVQNICFLWRSQRLRAIVCCHCGGSSSWLDWDPCHPVYAKGVLMVMEILTCVSRSPGPTASGCSVSGYGSSIPGLQWLWRKETEFLEGASNWFLL